MATFERDRPGVYTLHGELFMVGGTLMMRDEYTRQLLDVAYVLWRRSLNTHVAIVVSPYKPTKENR